MSDFHTAPLTEKNFNDFAAVMNSNRVSADCFCLSHLVPPAEMEVGKTAEQIMRKKVSSGQAHGLVGYLNEKPVLWLGIEPTEELIGHDLFEEFLQKEEGSEWLNRTTWGIHCLTSVPTLQNRKEYSSMMVKAAEGFVTRQKGLRLIAFPLVSSKYSDLQPNQRFAGSETLYESNGFKKAADINSYFSLWIKTLQAPGRHLRAVT